LTSKNRIPKKRLPVQANEAEGVAEQIEGADARDKTREAVPKLVHDKKFFYIS